MTKHNDFTETSAIEYLINIAENYLVAGNADDLKERLDRIAAATVQARKEHEAFLRMRHGITMLNNLASH